MLALGTKKITFGCLGTKKTPFGYKNGTFADHDLPHQRHPTPLTPAHALGTKKTPFGYKKNTLWLFGYPKNTLWVQKWHLWVQKKHPLGNSTTPFGYPKNSLWVQKWHYLLKTSIYPKGVIQSPHFWVQKKHHLQFLGTKKTPSGYQNDTFGYKKNTMPMVFFLYPKTLGTKKTQVKHSFFGTQQYVRLSQWCFFGTQK